MAYTKTAWTNDSAPALSAQNLNKIETGIFNADEMANTVNKNLSTTDSALQKTSTVGINKLDVSKMTAGYIISSDGTLSENVNRWTTDFIPFTPDDGKVYSSFQNSASATSRIGRTARAYAMYNANKEFISGSYWSGSSGKDVISSVTGCKFIRISYLNTDFENSADSTFKHQIEFNTTTPQTIHICHIISPIQ